ncbi:MAG: flagellar motor protein PomA [Oleispira sp.]
MDLASLIGILGAFGLVVMAMVMGGDIMMFVNIPSLLIVVAGSLCVVLMKFELATFFGSFGIMAKAFMFKTSKPEEIIEETVELAGLARKGGLLSLEGKEVSNDFLAKGIQLLVDGHDPEVVKALLGKDMKMAQERHKYGATFFTHMGDVGPAMGMIGTLIGLVAMLANMDDPKSIGPAMAVALLTTLYGAMMATMVMLPMADKLILRAEQESLIQSMIIDALIAIQGGQNPRVIEAMLQNYVKEKQRAVAE